MGNQETICLFRCSSVKTFEAGFAGTREYEFWAQYDTSVPEELRYSKATPSARVTITVDNPTVDFVVGRSYYFTIKEK